MKSKSRTGPQLQPFYWEEVILIALSALAVAGILPPIAITIHIRAVAG